MGHQQPRQIVEFRRKAAHLTEHNLIGSIEDFITHASHLLQGVTMSILPSTRNRAWGTMVGIFPNLTEPLHDPCRQHRYPRRSRRAHTAFWFRLGPGCHATGTPLKSGARLYPRHDAAASGGPTSTTPCAPNRLGSRLIDPLSLSSLPHNAPDDRGNR